MHNVCDLVCKQRWYSIAYLVILLRPASLKKIIVWKCL